MLIAQRAINWSKMRPLVGVDDLRWHNKYFGRKLKSPIDMLSSYGLLLVLYITRFTFKIHNCEECLGNKKLDDLFPFPISLFQFIELHIFRVCDKFCAHGKMHRKIFMHERRKNLMRKKMFRETELYYSRRFDGNYVNTNPLRLSAISQNIYLSRK